MYHTQYAKSSRGKCKRFKTKIEKGEVKLGKEVQVGEGDPWVQWYSVVGFKDVSDIRRFRSTLSFSQYFLNSSFD